ncbi:PIG-L family deacetylase [Candidatus Parcubacteria bacterium]|nr:MAG: PIG-L family deacetylase [Candidatus Parcubacteria bacterium]
MKVLFVFAHPDDETFSSGGTIAKLKSLRHTVKLVTATRGEKGQVGEPPITSREKLGEVRERELRFAAKVLGISEIFFLDYIDGELEKVGVEKLEKDVLKILRKENPDIVITFDKRGGSNHPDHKVMSVAATGAFNKFSEKAKKCVRLYHTAVPRSYIKKFEEAGFEYKAFGKVMGVPDDEITTVVDISAAYKKKLEAFKCYQTQRLDWERILKRVKVIDAKKEYFTLISEKEIA